MVEGISEVFAIYEDCERKNIVWGEMNTLKENMNTLQENMNTLKETEYLVRKRYLERKTNNQKTNRFPLYFSFTTNHCINICSKLHLKYVK